MVIKFDNEEKGKKETLYPQRTVQKPNQFSLINAQSKS